MLSATLLSAKKTKAMQHNNQHFDVIISGGGLSGSLMALSLSKLTKPDGQRLTMAIIESQAITATPASNKNNLFDARVLALSHGSAQYLKKLGVWSLIKNYVCPITDIDISDQGHYGKTRLSAHTHKLDALGYVIEMAHLGKAQLTLLNEHLNKQESATGNVGNDATDNNDSSSDANIHISNNNSKNSTDTVKHNNNINLNDTQNVYWFSGDSINTINWHAKSEEDFKSTNLAKVTVSLTSGQEISASLLLGCDGVQSPVRQLANIAVESVDYEQVALIANVATSKPHSNKAFERFTKNGPLAMLPLMPLLTKLGAVQELTSASRCSLVWTMTKEQAESLQRLNDKQFAQALEVAFGSYLGAITQVGRRETFPLRLLQAKQQTTHRLALIGNASHTIHPIAGQGFNLSLRDVQVMAENISAALAKGQDIGGFACLQAYQVNRQQDQHDIIKLTDSLVTLFANDLPPLVAGRNIALHMLNGLPSLKKVLMKKAMGY
jgi:2-octaprenyl-6-methoxyphenol hydroxylase